MSFFGKFKGGNAASAQATTASPAKKDLNVPQPTALEKHLQDAIGPVRPDGSDKFFGFENYGSTCYCNSIIQCLYYSAPFRDHVINFPPKEYLESIPQTTKDGAPLAPRSTSQIPYPNMTSPARKEPVAPTSPGGGQQKPPEESKDSPEYKKRMAIKSGLVLDMIHDRSNGYGMDESLFTALKDMFDAIKDNTSRYGVVSPHKFLEILRRENEMFRSAMHQDAHEFLNLLLNQVVDSVDLFAKQHPTLINHAPLNGGLEHAVSTTPKDSTVGLDTRWVHDLFEGLLTSETRCLSCETTSQRDEPFLDLSVDLSGHTSVTSCLRKFSEEEMLDERNKFHCDNCGGLQEAEKRMKIKRLPRVLALHLKRFKYTEDLQRLQKLFHRVVYPFHLRLFNTTNDAEDPDRLYELYAVVVHIGGGPYHGHYVSIVKTQDRGWLLFDDELVEPVDKAYVQSFFGGEPIPGLQDARQLACAYVLFYQETTLEAMLKEQELENHKPAADAAAAENGRASDVEAAKEPSATANGLHRVATATTSNPAGETSETEHMDPLAHAATAPMVASPDGPLASGTVPIERSKTRKEVKAEEKARKAAAKAEAKALEERRREASARRMEGWRKAQQDMAAAIEASKQSAAEEAKERGEDPAAGLSNQSKDQNTSGLSGLGRFTRHSSMNLRTKPKWMGGNSTSANKALPTQEENGSVVGAAEEDHVTPLSPTPAARLSGEQLSGAKRNRFSLGRKRSQAMA